MDPKDNLLTRGVVEVLPNREDLVKLIKTKKIRVYLGIDPTGTKLHLGHTIPMRKLQQFANLGHEAILLFGTGTVLAGDPSQRAQARPKISQKEIEKNIKTWQSQASKIISLDKVQIKKNGDWLLKLNLVNIVNIASHISTKQLYDRYMFQERIKRNDTVWMHEMLYPLLQGYDSVHMDVDLEIGGTDQTFNMLIGRELQKKMNNREKYVLTTHLISGTDGNPMSKTANNCIWLDDSPEDMFKKIMSTADTQISEYWTNLTELDSTLLSRLSPLEAKQELASEIVRIYHGNQAVKKAQSTFATLREYIEAQEIIEQGKNKAIPLSSLPTIPFPSGTTIFDATKQEAPIGTATYVKSLFRQEAVDLDFQKVDINDMNKPLKNSQTVRIGKKKIFRVKIEK